MRLVRSSGRSPAFRLNLRILAVAFCICALFGSIGFLDPFEIIGEVMRAKARRHLPDGQTVIVTIDDSSVRKVGQTPWPKARVGELIQQLHAAGAKQIALDLPAWGEEAPVEDAKFERILSETGRRVILPARIRIDPITRRRQYDLPPDNLLRWARTADIDLMPNWDGRVRSGQFSVAFGNKIVPTLASVMSGQKSEADDTYAVDLAPDLYKLPMISAADILARHWNPGRVAGKDVIIGEASSNSQTAGALGYGQIPPAFVQAAAVETLRTGVPIYAGWLWISLFALILGAIFLFCRSRAIARLALFTGYVGLTFGPIALEQARIYVMIMPAYTLLTLIMIGHLWFRIKRTVAARGTTNAVSGLPNLNALREGRHPATDLVVVARILNFANVATALPPECEKELVEQIVNRLGMGTNGSAIHQADDGLFIWLLDGTVDERLDEQLMALHALFHSPVIVQGRLIDLQMSFGIDSDRSRQLLQRVSSALVAADRAASEGRRWMTYDPAELEDADWNLSLLARLDQAIDQGEIWVAYQPKIDLATGHIVGAEALARWYHPEKGSIPPSQFIPAAERGGRIENLTAYILDSAVKAAKICCREGPADFSVSVNISARLLEGPGLLSMVQETLARHRLPPDQLILEVTETTAMASQDNVVATLQALSAAGVRLSIDDYGTGFSTLDYLKRIPAEEIKIDHSFVSMLEKSQSDRIMVHSTIQLAHSLGRKAVAEGVESNVILNELRLMQCDYVQGYLTGKPMALAEFVAILSSTPAVEVA